MEKCGMDARRNMARPETFSLSPMQYSYTMVVEAEHPCGSSVNIYKLHGITFQKTVIFSSLNKFRKSHHVWHNKTLHEQRRVVLNLATVRTTNLGDTRLLGITAFICFKWFTALYAGLLIHARFVAYSIYIGCSGSTIWGCVTLIFITCTYIRR
jgi:hypothetical protein